MTRTEQLLTQLERVASRIADDPGANLTRQRARIIQRIVGLDDEPTRLAFILAGVSEEIDELLAEIDRVAGLIQEHPNRDPTGPRAERIVERLLPRLRDAIAEADEGDGPGPPPATGVMIYSQLWMHLRPDLRAAQLEDAAAVGVHAFAINLHAPVAPNVPFRQRVVPDTSPWTHSGARYEMSRPTAWVAVAIRQHARLCTELGIRPGYYGVMGPDIARGHPQFSQLQYRNTPISSDEVRTFTGNFRAGWLDYWRWALDLAMEESDRVFAVDGVETEIHLSAPDLHAVVRSATPSRVSLYRNRHAESAGPGEEIHISPHEGNDTGGRGGMVVGDGWGRNRTRWPVQGAERRPYAALPDGGTEAAVAREFAGWVDAGRRQGRDYVGILTTMEWGPTSHAESVQYLDGQGPHRGTPDLLTPPWGAALEAMVDAAEAGGADDEIDPGSIEIIDPRAADPLGWPVTVRLEVSRFRDREQRWSPPMPWPGLDLFGGEPLAGTMWLVRDGRAAPVEWFFPGMTRQFLTAAMIADEARAFERPPQQGEVMGVFLSTPAWHGAERQSERQERTQIVQVRWGQ